MAGKIDYRREDVLQRVRGYRDRIKEAETMPDDSTRKARAHHVVSSLLTTLAVYVHDAELGDLINEIDRSHTECVYQLEAFKKEHEHDQ